MNKNITKLLLSAALMLCCTFSALAQLGTPPDNEIWYTTDNGSKLTSGKYDVGKTLCGSTISEHGEKDDHYYFKFNTDITVIAEKNFNDEDHLTEISLPNSVINLGYCAFYHCNKLKNLTLGSGLKSIGASGDGYGVFEECDELEGIAIPASVTLLGRNAFYDCDSLKFVAIGSGVTSITEQAFYNCNELMSVAIYGNGVSIGKNAFCDCEKLESVSFFGDTPPSSFGYDCFYDCSPNLKYHVLEENYVRYNGNSFLSGKVVAGPPYNEIWYSTNDGRTAGYEINGNPPALNAYMGSHGVQFFNGNPPEFSSDCSCFYDCNNLVSAVLPPSITYIGKYAFKNCTNLVSVSIPSTVTGIGDYAFNYCTSLQDIKLPDGLNSIGEYAFDHCYSLQSITIPQGVGGISCSAFCSTGLRSVTIFGTITGIGEYAFYNCTGLRSVTILGTITGIDKKAFFNCTNLSEIFYLGDGTPECNITTEYASFLYCPATIYVKDVSGHGNWGDRPVRSWRSGRGSGTKESPFEIENYVNLYGFSLEVAYMNGTNLCAKLTNNITGSNNVLNEDGTPKGVFKQWLPIGGEGYGYRGEFDGGGHTVSGLYFNDGSRQAVGLFGKAAGATDNPADRSYIHDVGVRDSYFRGKSHVGGICGDLAIGRMENCWNAATVQARDYVVGGLAGSCWNYATISGCHNVGKVSEVSESGGVCGAVYPSQIADYSLSNCVSLDTQCSKAYTLSGGCPESKIHNVFRKNAAAFASGEVCWILNGYQQSDKWRQQLGVDSYPNLSGNYLVYYNATSQAYYNYDGDISGSGTAEDPYRIGNKFELLMFANIVNTQNTAACGVLTADIIVNNNVLNSNGNLNSGTFETWTPIGTYSNAFAGTFNGEGHTISGLYVNDASKNYVGLFGITNGSAHIYDLGIKDCYFSGNNWVGGICGNLHSGTIENSWNGGATVISNSTDNTACCAGGIAASCWTNASVKGCYNIGKVSAQFENQCGGICGAVDGRVENCVTLDICNVGCNYVCGNATIDNVSIKNAAAFESGEVCWLLNGNKYGGHWRQQLGTDAYPKFNGTYFVNYTDERQYYNNEPTQEIWYTSTDGKTVTPYNSNSFGAGVTSNTYRGGQGVITFDRAVTSIGLSAFRDCSSLKSIEIPDNVTSIGQFAFFSCSSLQGINIPSGVTGIGGFAFRYCTSLQSINIPSGVTSIGEWALAQCNIMESVTFKSLPSVSYNAFNNCNSLSSKILDLTDSGKPYIGTSLANYPAGGFTEARYHGTLEPSQWGTIVLPFAPTSHSGIVFFSIDNVDAASGTLTLSVAENIEAGKPYLFRNQTGDAGFTLSAAPVTPATNVPVNITASEQTAGNFALKGNYSNNNVLTGNGLYQLDGDAFVNVGSLSIDPFRAYLKDDDGSAVDRIVIDGGTLVKITNQDDSTVTLYGLKKVEFIKENDTPAVRVTYADNSTATYENPKKVDFEK